ncbi:MAG: TIGR02710 family CRISPR-associated protein [Desulfovibrio sp.]|nr:TIGR02710 family CRISPR-associated protein [Desulfovibrio sp.]
MIEEKILNSDDFVLVLTAGLTPAPLIISIGEYKPKWVIFIATKETNPKVTEVVESENARRSIKRYETIILSDPEHFTQCALEIRREIPKKLEAMDLPENILLLADITGGTKAMIAAFATIMTEFNSQYVYVGGTERKDGRVVSGHERVIRTENPWDILGWNEAKALIDFYNSGQLTAAQNKAELLKDKLEEYKQFYDGISIAIRALQKWDLFNYTKAKEDLNLALDRRLSSYNNSHRKDFQTLYKNLSAARDALIEVEKEAKLLKGVSESAPADFGKAYFKDLIANARRRAERGRYDDAVARLYSAVEKVAKVALAKRGIDNSKITKEQLAKFDENLRTKYANASGDIKMAFDDSFAALSALAPDDPVSLAYTELEPELKKLMSSRNDSLLAHGYIPIDENTYKGFHDLVMRFMNITECELPEFPKMELKAILFN